MKQGRRAFLQAAGIAPAAAVTGLAATAASAAVVSGELRRAHFEPLVGERFAFEPDVFTRIGARLVSATPLAKAADGERSFRLLFDVDEGGSLGQGSWRVTHPALGTQVLSVSPNDADGRVVEAIFNRL